MDQNSYNTLIANTSSWLEIRLFYVRITPCVNEAVPDHLTLRHLRREASFTPLEINGSRVPASAASASVDLRRDRHNREVTYVSTDNVRVTGAVEFEVLEEGNMVLCGSLERMESNWGNGGNVGTEKDAKTGWSLECYVAASVGEGNSSFFLPNLGVSAPAIEVYIAGCCGGVPVILTKTILVSHRRRLSRHGALDAIPEDEEPDREQQDGGVGVGFGNGCATIRQRKVQITESEDDEYDLDGKFGNRYYSEDMNYGEDGQLSWFNAGVRVGVGIGLGMCLGIGIGVGLLMHSYQATTRNFRRRFF